MTPTLAVTYLYGMTDHGISAEDAGRAALATLVLAATSVACLWLVQYHEWVYNWRGGIQPATPGWTTPVAIAAGIGGVAVALLILRVHRTRA